MPGVWLLLPAPPPSFSAASSPRPVTRDEVCATCIVFVEHVVRRAPWQLLAAPAAVHREASHEQKRGKEDGDPHRPSTGPRKHLSVK